jgi:hypothetical protein
VALPIEKLAGVKSRTESNMSKSTIKISVHHLAMRLVFQRGSGCGVAPFSTPPGDAQSFWMFL